MIDDRKTHHSLTEHFSFLVVLKMSDIFYNEVHIQFTGPVTARW